MKATDIGVRQAFRASGPRGPALLLSLLLLLAVAFWGLHDKASLYQPTGHGMPVAKAKLLSGRELAADAVNHTQAFLPPVLPQIFLYLSAALLTLFRAERQVSVALFLSTPPLRTPAWTPNLDRRPPPSF